MGKVVLMRRRINIPASALMMIETLGLPPIGEPLYFTFKRRKTGVEVFLKFKGGLGLNMTIDQNLKLKNFAEARKWASDYARDHGFKAMELKPTKKPKPRPPFLLVTTPSVLS